MISMRMGNRRRKQITDWMKKRRAVKGSFTVEAAFLMPIIFFLIFSFLYLTFYLHDSSRIQGCLDKALHRTTLVLKHEYDFAAGEIRYEEINNRGIIDLITGDTKDLEQEICQYVCREFSEGLFVTKITNVTTKVGRYNIEVEVEAETKISLRGVLSFFYPNRKRTIKKKYSIHDPAETIRISEVILDTGTKIKGVEEWAERIKNIGKIK